MVDFTSCCRDPSRSQAGFAGSPAKTSHPPRPPRPQLQQPCSRPVKFIAPNPKAPKACLEPSVPTAPKASSPQGPTRKPQSQSSAYNALSSPPPPHPGGTQCPDCQGTLEASHESAELPPTYRWPGPGSVHEAPRLLEPCLRFRGL